MGVCRDVERGTSPPGAVQRPVQEQEKKVTKGDRNQSLHNYLISE